MLVEIGGTVGDIESLPFLEAIRQFRQDVGRDNTIFVHLTLVPYIGTAGELKTKPTQHSVRELRSIGIQPDILLCRTDRFLSPDIKGKIALFCDVPEEAVITAKDVDSIYEVPLVLAGEGLDAIVLKAAGPPQQRAATWRPGRSSSSASRTRRTRSSIGIVGKYVAFEDSYKSLNEALSHGGFGNQREGGAALGRGRGARGRRTRTPSSAGVDGILVPGRLRHPRHGRHDGGGRVRAAHRARPTSASATASSGRSRSTRATSAAWPAPTPPRWTRDAEHKVIYKLRDLLGVDDLGGTMRLGSYACELGPARAPRAIYGATEIRERHRHRYEFN